MRKKENRCGVRVSISSVTHNLMVLYSNHTGLPYSRICDNAIREFLQQGTIEVPEGPRSNGSNKLGTTKKSCYFYISPNLYEDVTTIVEKLHPQYPQISISFIFEQALTKYLK